MTITSIVILQIKEIASCSLHLINLDSPFNQVFPYWLLMKLSEVFTYSRGVDAQFSGQYEKSSPQYVDIYLWRRVTF